MEGIQRVDMTEVLDLAIAEARKWEGHLGKRRKGRAVRAFEPLRNGQIKLDNPQALVLRIRPEDFKERGIPLSSEIKRSMQGATGYNFYVVSVPVLLFPRRGAQYRLVESQLSFATTHGKRPLAIQNIFPSPFWKPVLKWGGAFNLGLNSELEWVAEVEEGQVKEGQLSRELASRVKLANQVSSFFKIMTFSHTLGRMEIEAQFSAGTALWRLDSKQVIRGQKQTKFLALLKVPKEVSRVRLEAAVQAKVSFNWLAAQIEHVFARLPQLIQQMIRRREGFPLQSFEVWSLELPKSESVPITLDSDDLGHSSTSSTKTPKVKSSAQEKASPEVGEAHDVATLPKMVSSSDSKASSNSQQSVNDILSFAECAELAQLLLAIPSIAEGGRRASVISHLRPEIKTNVAYNSVHKIDVFNLVNTCLQHPGGMQELRDILQFFEGDSIPMQQFKEAIGRLLPSG